MKEKLVAWLLAAMQSWVPAAQHDHYQPREKTEATYREIAEAEAEAALDDTTIPLFAGDGAEGRAKTALLGIAVASWESSFNSVIAHGGSVRPGDNDNGLAVGPWQTHVYGRTEDGWTRKDLANDLVKAATLGLRRMRESFKVCGAVEMRYRLGFYVAGRGSCPRSWKSAQRVDRALAWWREHPFIP